MSNHLDGFSVWDAATVIISMLALTVSWWQFLSNRPRLRTDVTPSVIIIDGGHIGDVLYTRITVTNTGSQPTIVQNIGFSSYRNWVDVLMKKNGNHCVVKADSRELADMLPKRIAPGDSVNILAIQNDHSTESFFQSYQLFVWVQHTWDQKPKVNRVSKLVMRSLRSPQ